MSGALKAVEEEGDERFQMHHRARRFHHLRASLAPVVAALIAIALLCGVGMVALVESNDTVRKDAQQRIESNRDSAIRAISRQAGDLMRTIETYAGNPAVIGGLTSATGELAAEEQMGLLARSKGAPAVILSNLKGDNVAIAPPLPDLLGKNFAFRDWFKGAQRTGKPYVSSGYRSVAPGNPLVVGISTPVFHGRTRVGYLTILGQLDQVRAVAEGARQDDGVIITVTDQTGQQLTQALPVDSRGEPTSTTVTEATRAALEGQNVNVVGEHDLASAASVAGIGWTVTASLPTAVAMAPAAGFRQSLALTLCAALLLVLLFAGFSIRASRRRAADHDVVAVERARLTALFAASPIGILECNAERTVLTVNDALSTMLGYEPDELTGVHAPEVLLPHQFADVDADMTAVLSGEIDHYSRERLFRAKDGTLVPAHTSVIVVREGNGEVRSIVAFVVDQREQKRVESALRESEERLTELALHDELTGLPNRRLLFTRCTEAFTAAREAGIEGTSIAALFIDLDGFKPINDHYGHDTGDQLLVEIADDLRACLDPLDTVARVGGDEFVVLLADYLGHEHLLAIAERTAHAVRRTVGANGHTLQVTASVGVASIDLAIEPNARPDQLLGRADAAMYLAKERGPDRREVFRSTLDRDVHLPNPRAELPGPRVAL
jgi:diguanylate cyclase (GGDEF)-like protein/PAS domain S-box-containing protein